MGTARASGHERDDAGAEPPADLDQLRADVARLHAAVAEAGAVLSGVGPAASSLASPGPGVATADGGSEARWSLRSNAARKGVRTGVQLGIAAAPSAALWVGGILPAAATPWLALVVTPLVSYGQNKLEDRKVVKPLLRNPPP
ncbi:hypothetical protein KSP35_11460 [Aquihabitans sp. G128]|uniref:hypothetical protein n=1 Tax=Aquihabitans sp. G128 TaxID=2849779 RepID=UPI001C231A26|nr:hypothetical protein [Aquihabitans sp. G128]QXC63345.1 hypothetical protein KSP35_11460 [Aquihabitans sp. G128]